MFTGFRIVVRILVTLSLLLPAPWSSAQQRGEDEAYLTAVPREISLDQVMAEASRLHFRNLSYFSDGVYGKFGSTVIYMSTLDKIPDYDRLYWVMVQVLSKKFGCMINRRVDAGDRLTFYCRDSRIVVMQRSVGKALIRFRATQYDASGRELIVEKHRVVNRPFSH